LSERFLVKDFRTAWYLRAVDKETEGNPSRVISWLS